MPKARLEPTIQAYLLEVVLLASEAQKRAAAKYKRENVKTKLLRFFPKDADLLEWVEQQDGQNAYILGLIREDMERRCQ